MTEYTQEQLSEAARILNVDIIAGEPMVCEGHPWRAWPSQDEGCPGPGMPLSAIEHHFQDAH